jgi:hypothetical protein
MKFEFPGLLLFSVMLSAVSYGQIVVPEPNGYQIIDDHDGEQITKYTYDFIDEPSSGLCIFYDERYGGFGYHSKSGNIQISTDFDIAYPFKGHFALVGVHGRYHYINQKGEKFGKVDWPKAPEVFEEFLIVRDSLSRVYHKDGEMVLLTPHQLIATPLSGILEWNKDSNWVKQYVGGSHYGEIREANQFHHVTNLVTTWQGYACIEFDTTFSIYDRRGDLLFENQPSQGYYLPVKVVWNTYLYLPDQHPSTWFENELHRELLYPANKIHHNYGYNLYGAAVLIGEGFKKEDVALITGTEKWALYTSDHHIEGSYLFDEVLPSDQHDYLLVRQNMTWSVYLKSQDSIIPLGFRYIHHRGLVNGIFFGSNDTQPYEDRKWSLNLLERQSGDMQLDLSELEVYQFPRSYYIPHKYQILPKITESEDHLFLLRGDSTVVINAFGKEVYQYKFDTDDHLQMEDFFMPHFCLKEASLKPIESMKRLRRNEVGLYLSVDGQELRLVLANTSKEPFHQANYGVVGADNIYEDGLIEVYLEYQNRKGDWQPITRFAGDTYTEWQNAVEILPNQCLHASISFPKGPIGPVYNVRAKLVQNDRLSMMYSNTVQMNLFPGLLYGNPYFDQYGALSKYQLITP